jgi:hypothetical protein
MQQSWAYLLKSQTRGHRRCQPVDAGGYHERLEGFEPLAAMAAGRLTTAAAVISPRLASGRFQVDNPGGIPPFSAIWEATAPFE